MKTSEELYQKLDKFTTKDQKLKIVYQWVKQGTINFKTFCELIESI